MRIKVLLGMNLLILLVSLIQSCCLKSYEWQITSIHDIKVRELNSSTPNNDTISGEFHLIASFNEELVQYQKSFDLMNSAYASKCHEEWINHILYDSFQLTLDKEFIYKGDTIPKNENILSLPDIEKGYYAGFDIHFTKAFFDNSIFNKGEFVFKLTGKTSDDIELKGDKMIFIDI